MAAIGIGTFVPSLAEIVAALNDHDRAASAAGGGPGAGAGAAPGASASAPPAAAARPRRPTLVPVYK
jgi:hypothetical protein